MQPAGGQCAGRRHGAHHQPHMADEHALRRLQLLQTGRVRRRLLPHMAGAQRLPLPRQAPAAQPLLARVRAPLRQAARALMVRGAHRRRAVQRR